MDFKPKRSFVQNIMHTARRVISQASITDEEIQKKEVRIRRIEQSFRAVNAACAFEIN